MNEEKYLQYIVDRLQTIINATSHDEQIAYFMMRLQSEIQEQIKTLNGASSS